MLSIFPFLASSIMLTSFFFMVILSSVSPVMAPFDASLEMLKILFNAWGTYRTFFNFNVYHPCSFIFTVHFSSHFIFWPLPMSHQYHIIQYLSYFSTCILCAMTHRCLPTIIWGLIRFHFLILIHRMWLPQIGCWLHLLSVSSSTNN